MTGVLMLHGCCGRWRGTLTVNLGAERGLITIEAFGKSRAEAKTATFDLAGWVGIPGLELDVDVRER